MYQSKNEIISPVPDYRGIGVYAIVNNNNGKMYIGSSKNIRTRILQHRASFKSLNCPMSFKNDIDKGDKFTVKILEKLPYGIDQFYLFSREKYFIDFYDTLNTGYNTAKTTSSTKEELLQQLEHYKNAPVMSKYIKDLIAKKERTITKARSIENDQCIITLNSRALEEIKEHAEKMGESLNGYINRAIDETMIRDDNQPAN